MSENVQLTADALSVIRADPKLRVQFSIDDPYAELFVTPEGQTMLETAQAVDSVYLEFNLARYRYFSAKLASAASEFAQLLILGAGYDTRAIWMDEFRNAECRVFEVDYADKLKSKRELLTRKGIVIPERIRLVGSDLGSSNTQARLIAAGYRPSLKTFVAMEGLVFFLDDYVTEKILQRNWLGLVEGSRVIFDFWANERINELNERVAERLGKPLFGKFPFSDEPQILEKQLVASGYRSAAVVSLEAILAQLGITCGHSTPWYITEAYV